MINDDIITVAKHINWYTDPTRLLTDEHLFLCQVMARGLLNDIIIIQQYFSRDQFIDAYHRAPTGLFSKQAWAYWGLILLGNPKALPLPERFPGGNNFNWRNTCNV